LWVPGNLVRLKQPYKPDERDRFLQRIWAAKWRYENGEEPGADDALETLRAWRAWPGFTHGIIVQVLPPSSTCPPVPSG
jgi:hypothetical protein